MASSRERLFVSISLPQQVVEDLCKLRQDLDGFRWMDRGNIHLTLRFIGACSPEDRQDLEQALEGVSTAPFQLEPAGLGIFNRNGQPSILMVGIREPCHELMLLRGLVDQALGRAGFVPEKRDYNPHITLARLRGVEPEVLEDFLSTNQGTVSSPFEVEEFSLMQSIFQDGAVRYERLWSRQL